METKNWKWFRYDEIFEIKKGKRLTKADMIEGKINYIGATDSNNGITAKISNSEQIHGGNLITVSYNGSIAEAFYQIEPFWATDDVNVLYPKFELNRFIALFLCSLIQKEKYRFNYGRKWDKETMEQSAIKLPIDKNNNSDWQWIENYVKEKLLPELPQKAKNVWLHSFDTAPFLTEKKQLDTKNWQWFDYKTLFEITGSTTTPKLELEESGVGQFPYVTTQAGNNGIEGYFNLHTEIGNVFTVDSAVLGFCSYQVKDFSASDHVEKLIPKFPCNVYIAMFITTIINREQYRYNYGRKCSQTKLKAAKILLPAILNSQNEYIPDFQFMEDYIKSLPYSRCL
ncbi:MAG: restriction endonuclease subunit S [Bacteroidales bacterium]|nr:restriction endonuclease subunit S [Bacteroidales bacterium]